MKIIFVIMFSLATFQARADIDCDIKLGVGEKITESKAKFKKTQDDKEVTTYETDKEGYTFTAIARKSEPTNLQQVGILDKAKNSRTVATYHGMKPDSPDAFLMAVLFDGGTNPSKFAKLSCKVRQ
jgi:hypothetical protein